MKKILSSLISLFIMLSAFAQEQITNDERLKEESNIYIQTYPQLFETAEIKEIHKIDKDHKIIRYLKQGTYFETIVNANREEMLLLETAQLIPKNELPQIVLDAFKANYGSSFELKRQFTVERPHTQQLFRLDAINTKKEIANTFYFNHLGEEKESSL